MTNSNMDRLPIGVAKKLGDLVEARIVDGIIHGSSINSKPEHEPYMGPEGKDSLTVTRSTDLLTFTETRICESDTIIIKPLLVRRSKPRLTCARPKRQEWDRYRLVQVPG